VDVFAGLVACSTTNDELFKAAGNFTSGIITFRYETIHLPDHSFSGDWKLGGEVKGTGGKGGGVVVQHVSCNNFTIILWTVP
jgi:hypothetical protein